MKHTENTTLTNFNNGLSVENNIVLVDTPINCVSDNIIEVKKTSKSQKVLSILKTVFGFITKHILFFAVNRIVFATRAFLSFNFLLIGIVCAEWWFYNEAFYNHLLPFVKTTFNIG